MPLATAVRLLPNKSAVVAKVGAFCVADLDLRVSRALHPDDARLWRDMPLTGTGNKSPFTVNEILEAASRCESMPEFRSLEPVMFPHVSRMGLMEEVKRRIEFNRGRNERIRRSSEERRRLYRFAFQPSGDPHRPRHQIKRHKYL